MVLFPQKMLFHSNNWMYETSCKPTSRESRVHLEGTGLVKALDDVQRGLGLIVLENRDRDDVEVCEKLKISWL